MAVGLLFRGRTAGLTLGKRAERTDVEADILKARMARFCEVRYSLHERSVRPETRVKQRFVPAERETFLTCAVGRQIKARVLNISRFAVAIEADFSRIAGETVVKVGTRRVHPGRTIRGGRVFMFEKALSESICGPDIIL